MKRLLAALVRFMVRVSLVLMASALIAATALTGYEFIRLFNHTSYRFVALFLLVIFLSNLLSKIARAYSDV